jgi:uncharacterized protein
VDISARDMFQLMRKQWLGRAGMFTGELLADDVIIETPFAAPGRPRRFEGKQQWLAFATPERAAFPLHIDDSRTLAIHDTTDPGTIVVEYELTASTPAGRQGSATFIGVLTVRDGKIVLWREYQNTLALQQALA